MNDHGNLTRQQQVEEIKKCGRNPEYFIKTYTKIQHPTKGNIAFDTYPFQDDCVRDFEKHRLNIVLKSRQLGLSTICAAYAVWKAIFYKDKNVLVIATKLLTAQNFIKKVAFIIQNLPKWLLLPKFEPSKQQITFSNGSQVKAIPTSSDAGRSEALSLLIIDEAAFIKDFDDIWTGLAPTFSTGGSAIILSTPNGVGGQYYNLWTNAEAGINEFNPIKIMWYQHPEHDQLWFDKETSSLPKKKISQEYLCDFVSSGDTFLQSDQLEYLRNLIKQPEEKTGDKREIWVWENPKPESEYLLSADVSRGDARDFSGFHIVDIVQKEVVAEYMGKLHPDKFASLINEWGKKYNNALVIPENNSFGFMVCSKLKNLNYKKLYYHENKGSPFNYVPVDPEEELAGFPTNQKTRVEILTKLEELIRNKQLKVYSQRLYNQLQSFVWQGNKPQAQKDSFDDLVMSVAIGTYLLDVNNVSGMNPGAELAYAMLKASGVTRRDQSAIGGNIDSVRPVQNANMRNFNPRVRHPNQQSRYAEHSDFSWLTRLFNRNKGVHTNVNNEKTTSKSKSTKKDHQRRTFSS